MATLTYWYCECIGDSDAYSIIAKTKKEATSARQLAGEEYTRPPIKKTLHYKDAFDLFDWATGEGGGRGCGDSSCN
jgi:hypothetical protein